MTFRKYYDGNDSQDEETQKLPPYPGDNNGALYVLRVGTAHSGGKRSCGISKTYLVPGLNKSLAVSDFLEWCRDVVADVRNNMDEADLAEVEWDVCHDITDSRMRKIRSLEKKIEAINEQLDDPKVFWSEANKLREERRQATDEHRCLAEELKSRDVDPVSRFELIVKPLRTLIVWLESEWFEIERMPTNSPLPVGRLGDWYGFTTYHKKELMP